MRLYELKGKEGRGSTGESGRQDKGLWVCAREAEEEKIPSINQNIKKLISVSDPPPSRHSPSDI